jgi:glyoxylase-like metal-dependent hydrolase (beta-lactamase superfamily II)
VLVAELPGGRAVFVGDMVANTDGPTWQCSFGTQPERMRDSIDKVRAELTPGSVVHPGHGAPVPGETIKALPLIIDGYLEQGYRFVTMSELIGAEER